MCQNSIKTTRIYYLFQRFFFPFNFPSFTIILDHVFPHKRQTLRTVCKRDKFFFSDFVKLIMIIFIKTT